MTNAFRKITEAKERSARAAERIAAAQENLVRNFDAFTQVLDGIEQPGPPDAAKAGKVSPRKPEVRK